MKYFLRFLDDSGKWGFVECQQAFVYSLLPSVLR